MFVSYFFVFFYLPFFGFRFGFPRQQNHIGVQEPHQTSSDTPIFGVASPNVKLMSKLGIFLYQLTLVNNYQDVKESEQLKLGGHTAPLGPQCRYFGSRRPLPMGSHKTLRGPYPTIPTVCKLFWSSLLQPCAGPTKI